MSTYLFDSISLNQRDISISDILAGSIPGNSGFEKETLSFLKDWLSGTKQFSIQTSGSTGNPKSILISREQMQQSARMTIQALNLSPSDVSLVCLPTKYIAGKMMLVRSLVNNMKIVAVEPSSNPLENIHPTTNLHFAAFIPLQLQTMLEAGLAYRINTIKNILLGGAAVNSALRDRILSELSTNVFATYGMTETITHIALQNIRQESEKNNFRCLPGVQVQLDSRGCLVIEAPYLKEPVITNDLAELTNTHSFRWLGRADSVINSGGIKIIPEQLESIVGSVVASIPLSKRFFIAGLPDERLGEKVVLFMEGTKLPTEAEQKLIDLIRKHLSGQTPHGTPREIRYIARFSETETGKIQVGETLKAL